ncbi:hypothetical protein ACJMK2_030913, partial [Sinanodonta woodiana]
NFANPPAAVNVGELTWKRGDLCHAKYWEDNQFYNAVIEAVAPGLPTCFVTFTDYGNTEEVLLSDIRPLPKQSVNQAFEIQAPPPVPPTQQPTVSLPQYQTVVPPTVFFTSPPQFQLQPVDVSGGTINSMEFRRGGGGNIYNSNRKSGRPPIQLYQPPPQRK